MYPHTVAKLMQIVACVATHQIIQLCNPTISGVSLSPFPPVFRGHYPDSSYKGCSCCLEVHRENLATSPARLVLCSFLLGRGRAEPWLLLVAEAASAAVDGLIPLQRECAVVHVLGGALQESLYC